jgi:hypothetical protein
MVAGILLAVVFSVVTIFVVWLITKDNNDSISPRQQAKKLAVLEKRNKELEEYNKALQVVNNWTPPKELNAEKE